MTATAVPAERLAAALDSAGRDGLAAWSEVLQGQLGDEVEIRHDPPVEGLDGWRDRQASIDYLRAEVVAFPRAFSEFRPRIETAVEADGSIVSTVVYAGTLAPDGPAVEVGFRLVIKLAGGDVVLLAAEYLPETDRRDLIAWLKAVEAAGGFHPPAPGRP